MPWSKENGVTCFICNDPVPVYCSVMWCDSCMDEFLKSGKSSLRFIAEERVKRGQY